MRGGKTVTKGFIDCFGGIMTINQAIVVVHTPRNNNQEMLLFLSI